MDSLLPPIILTSLSEKEPHLFCLKCGVESGTKLICDGCHKGFSRGQITTWLRAWHEYVVRRDGCKCVYCGASHPWESGKLCGNHKEPQGRRRDLRFDVTNGECCCMFCNGQFSYTAPMEQKKERIEKQKKAKKAPICKKCRVIFAMGTGKKPELCWKCQ
jgi:hypothetical protein